MSVAKGFDWTLKEAKRLKCDVIQIFLKNPRSWEKKVLRDEEIVAFSRLTQEVPVIGHLSYLPNLARIDEDERNLEGLIHEAGLCETLGIDRLVVHCGSRPNSKKGVRMAAEAVNRVLQQHDVTVLLENSAGQGQAIGRNIEELAAICEKIDRSDKVLLCVDTAHLFESGCDVRVRKTWRGFLAEVDRNLGRDKIGFFHLNDSKTSLASGVDRHWHIGKGEIGVGFFRFLLNDKRLAHLGGVMETPKMGKMDEENMRTMRSLLSPLMSRSLA